MLAAIAAVPRDRFVPRDLRHRAWENGPLPIGGGQTISQPLVVARMCELLDVHPGDRVLDVGTGSGYHAAVLAALGGRVTSIERDPALARTAAGRLGDDVEVLTGDGTLGHAAGGPYDAICVAAATAAVPPALPEQLADGGRLVLPVGPPDGQRLHRLTRRGERLETEVLEEVRFVPLIAG